VGASIDECDSAELPAGAPVPNIDLKTVAGFGEEWSAYDQTELGFDEWSELFENYFSVFPFDELPPNSEGFDLGCGSGRWAAGVAPRVGTLHCIDPSDKALEVAKARLAHQPNVRFHLANGGAIPLSENSQDFGYSLGVLHHIPDTRAAMRHCVSKLKRGAPFLVYLYYALEQRSGWYRSLWKVSEVGRRAISLMPIGPRKWVTTLLAAAAYWPMAKAAKCSERLGFDVSKMPLSFYRNCSFYTMRTDALDRFGTRLEQRFTREEIRQMMEEGGLRDIVFREDEPYWVACGRKA
jgi:ubiquinone/menaquinone biosynthesis C-methylase UbiE